MAMDWSFGTHANGAGERLIQASRNIGDAFRDAGTKITHGASAGADYARSLGDDVFEESRRAARTTRRVVEERPLEALLMVGLASFALGWLLRRMREPAPKRAASPVRAARPTRRRTR
jgi:ElaB/YqjD/DUF883 family membrane-anchored ribosome-binding protein